MRSCLLFTFPGDDSALARPQKPLERIPQKAEHGDHDCHQDGQKDTDRGHARSRADICHGRPGKATDQEQKENDVFE
jgi:hypothetical protein